MSKEITKEDVLLHTENILADPEKFFEGWGEALGILFALCREADVGCEFRYDTGWFRQRADSGWLDPDVDEETKGFTVEVACRAPSMDGEKGMVYKNPSTAVMDGYNLLKEYLTEHLCETD